jgi:anti-sigma factor RsiW
MSAPQIPCGPNLSEREGLKAYLHSSLQQLGEGEKGPGEALLGPQEGAGPVGTGLCSSGARGSEGCRRARILISLSIDGEIDALRERELRRHLAACPRCSLLLHEHEAISTLLRSSRRERPSMPIRPPTAGGCPAQRGHGCRGTAPSAPAKDACRQGPDIGRGARRPETEGDGETPWLRPNKRGLLSRLAILSNWALWAEPTAACPSRTARLDPPFGYAAGIPSLASADSAAIAGSIASSSLCQRSSASRCSSERR